MKTNGPFWIAAVLAAGGSMIARPLAASKFATATNRVRITTLLAAVLAMTWPAMAASTDYDGKWRLDGTCSASTSWPWSPAITFYTNITIQSGSISEVKEYLASGIKAKDSWSGGVQNNALNLLDDGQNERSGKWQRKLTGQVVSASEIGFTGDFSQWVVNGWVKSRTCSGTLRSTEPVPISLAARELGHGGLAQNSPAPAATATAQQRQPAQAEQLAALQRQQAQAEQLAAQQRQLAEAEQRLAQQRQQTQAEQLAAQQRQQADAAQQRQQIEVVQRAAQQNTGPAAAPGARVALVIGNGAYVNADPLRNPSNDANAVAGVLRQIGFDVVQGVDLNRLGLEEKIRDFMRRALKARVALLFYSGHGMQVDGKNYLIPVDAKLTEPSDLFFETVEIDKTLDTLADPSRTTIILLDACRDNPMAKRFIRRLPGATRSASVPSGLAAYSAVGTGTLIAYATAPGQTALDGKGANSPFTTSLVKYLRVPGLEIRQLLTRVRADVAAATDNQQIPWDNSSLMGDVYLVK
jgi:hypothetical protein